MLPAKTLNKRAIHGKNAGRVGRGKYWLITVWCDKFPDGFRDELLFEFADWSRIGYARWQRESAPVTGRKHWQCYVELRKQEYIGWVAECLPGWISGSYHVDKVNNNFAMAALYCSKQYTHAGGGSAFECGVYIGGVLSELESGGGEEGTRRGQRSDLQFVGSFVRDGGSERDAAFLDAGIYVKHFKGLRAIAELCCDSGAGKRAAARSVYVLVGPSGSGKTRGVLKRHPGDREVFSLPLGNGTSTWWDGYRGQDVVLIDEFEGEGLAWSTLKQITDPWHNVTAPIKGGFTALTASVMYIVSNMEPEKWYPKVSEHHWPELNRRVTAWVDYGRSEVDMPKFGAGKLRQWVTPEDVFGDDARVYDE